MSILLERVQDSCPEYYITLDELRELFCLDSPVYWGCQHRLKLVIRNSDGIVYRRFVHDFDVYGLDISGHQSVLRKLCLLNNLRHLRLRNMCLNGITYSGLTELALISCSQVSMVVVATIVTLRTLIVRNIEINLLCLPPYLRVLIVSGAGLKSLRGIERCCGLEKVVLCNNPIRKIRRLGMLVGLKYLDLSWTEVSDLGCLVTLKRLRYLNVSDSRVVDYGWVQWLPKLRILYVRYPYRTRIR
jgi:hypothetical protein